MHLVDVMYWKSFPMEMMTPLSYAVNTVATADLVTQEVKVSVATILT